MEGAAAREFREEGGWLSRLSLGHIAMVTNADQRKWRHVHISAVPPNLPARFPNRQSNRWVTFGRTTWTGALPPPWPWGNPELPRLSGPGIELRSRCCIRPCVNARQEDKQYKCAEVGRFHKGTKATMVIGERRGGEEGDGEGRGEGRWNEMSGDSLDDCVQLDVSFHHEVGA